MLAEGIGFSTVMRKEAGEAQPAETGLGVNPSDNHPERGCGGVSIEQPSLPDGTGCCVRIYHRLASWKDVFEATCKESLRGKRVLICCLRVLGSLDSGDL